jgi:hypothetical protein
MTTTTTTKRETGLAPPLRSRPTAHCVRGGYADEDDEAPAQEPHGSHGAAYAPAAAAAAASIAGACGTGRAGAGAAVDAASDVDAEADHGAWRVAEDAVDTWSTGGTARNSVTVMSSLGRCMRAGRGGLVSACVAFASGGGSASAGTYNDRGGLRVRASSRIRCPRPSPPHHDTPPTSHRIAPIPSHSTLSVPSYPIVACALPASLSGAREFSVRVVLIRPHDVILLTPCDS